MLFQTEVGVARSTCSSPCRFVPVWRLHPSGLLSRLPVSFCIVPSPACCCARGAATLCILPSCRVGRGASAAVPAPLSLPALANLPSRRQCLSISMLLSTRSCCFGGG